MQEVVARADDVYFEIEEAMDCHLGAQPLPFPGMDKSGSAVCTFYIHAQCAKGAACPFRHVRGDKSIVCKHWLRGLCKKGDDCEFLHEFDMSKMPECYFFSKFGQCGNKECPFLHIDPEKKRVDCPWYDRGFCRHGPHCKNRHVKRVMCQNFLCGFCLDGPNCKYVHPKFDIPFVDPAGAIKKSTVVCHQCHEMGHKAIACPKLNQNRNLHNLGGAGQPYTPHHTPNQNQQGNLTTIQVVNSGQPPPQSNFQPGRRDVKDVTCFKCGEKGHYANRCPKGHLAFLHNTGDGQQHQR